MSHTALARKYRPRRFAEVTRQEHVSETLRGAVAGDRVGHAYLFSGPRGVGKTTLARVLAMALNCPRREAVGEPCGTCENCRRIWAGHTSLDVVEIDAASNRGVEDARQLRERAMYAPSQDGRFKVYIVDEAHMLTREAWNALLKILEEPPPRVIFVFATTEPQKIEQSAAPILSRCQRFDFRRIGATAIEERLREVMDAEGARADAAALATIARRAQGGMRDALSSLDQVLSLSGGEVTLDSARRVLGLVEDERYLDVFRILAGDAPGEIFPFVQDLMDEGYDLVEFYHGFAEALRRLLRLALDSPDGSDTSPEWTERAASFHAGDLLRMLHMAADLESTGSLKRTGNPRILIEMLLLRCAYLERTVRLEDLLMGGGADAAPGAPPTGASSGGSRRAPQANAAGSRPSVDASPSHRPAPEGPPVAPLEAWSAVVSAGEGLPSGVRPFLEAARASQVDPSTVALTLPAGPAWERMSGPGVVPALQAALSRHAGRPVTLDLRRAPDKGAESDRITPEEVRRTRLEELLGKEPALREAVEELDLELLD